MRDILLATQIALCALLLTAALVALRGMQRSLHAPLGFQPEGVVTAETDLHMAGYSDQSSLVVQKRMLEQASHIPGVTAVGSINELPLNTGGSGTPVYREGTTDFRDSNSVLVAKYYSISPGYLRAAETRLLRGRDFSWHDDAATTKVALVNGTFARVMFGDVLPIGRHFMIGEKSLYEIVGIVEDGKYDSLTESPQPAMFFPLAQNGDSDTTVIVRSALPPAEVARALQRTLAGIDPDLPFTIRNWPDELAVMYFPARSSHDQSRGHGDVGGDARGDWDLWDGGLFNLQTLEGARHSRLPWCTAGATHAFCVRASARDFDYWLRSRAGGRCACQSPAGTDRLSSYAPRPAGALRSPAHHGLAGCGRHLDSRAARPGSRPRTTAQGRVTWGGSAKKSSILSACCAERPCK